MKFMLPLIVRLESKWRCYPQHRSWRELIGVESCREEVITSHVIVGFITWSLHFRLWFFCTKGCSGSRPFGGQWLLITCCYVHIWISDGKDPNKVIWVVNEDAIERLHSDSENFYFYVTSWWHQIKLIILFVLHLAYYLSAQKGHTAVDMKTT
jgi:hypothetical protein